MSKIQSLDIGHRTKDIGQSIYALIYKELLKGSREGQNTKYDQGYEIILKHTLTHRNTLLPTRTVTQDLTVFLNV